MYDCDPWLNPIHSLRVAVLCGCMDVFQPDWPIFTNSLQHVIGVRLLAVWCSAVASSISWSSYYGVACADGGTVQHVKRPVNGVRFGPEFLSGFSSQVR